MELFKTDTTKYANVAGTNNPSNDAVYKAQQGSCFECHKPFGFYTANEKDAGGYTVEHVFPEGLGFGLFGNKVLTCLECNRRKANKLPDYEYVGAVRQLYRQIFPRNAIEALRQMGHPIWTRRILTTRHSH